LAVAIEFVNVIVRKSAVASRFPGGLDGFARQDLSNLTEDEHLLRVGFMSTALAWDFVSELEAVGLRYLGPVADSDMAVVGWDNSPAPPWLSEGDIGGHWACWDSDYPPGEVVWPEPGFWLRCPRAVYDSLAAVVRRCGADFRNVAAGAQPGALAELRCVRGDAEIVIEIVGEREGDSPVGIWGRRQLARRMQFPADVALIRDLVARLVQEGASTS
jgi:hypothetical protein